MGASASFSRNASSSSGCLIVSIDGNIGSGKTTGKAKLREYIMSLKRKNEDNSILFVDEPTSDWEQIKDESGVPILTNLYTDVKRFAFRFQMMAYITRLRKLRQALKTPNVRLIITERCLLTDAHVFAKMLYDSKQIEEDEYDIYTRWFDEFAKEVEPSCIIYFKASTEVCMNRIQKRNRPGENKIGFDYLESCNNYHDEWLNSVPSKITIPTLILNADVEESAYEYSADIYHFINSLRASRTVGVMHRLKTYIDGNQFKMYSPEEKENADNYYCWYQAPPSPPLSTHKECRKHRDRMSLLKFGPTSYLHFDE
jgi:deoxyadenosine/deoxycytidine kinase